MNHNTNEKPTGDQKEERLALAFGRAYSDADAVAPLWLGYDYLDDQREAMERAAKERDITIAAFAVGYQRRGPGMRAVLGYVMNLAQEHGIRTLLVPTRRYLAGLKTDTPPYFWERTFKEAGFEIIEAPPEDWL